MLRSIRRSSMPAVLEHPQGPLGPQEDSLSWPLSRDSMAGGRMEQARDRCGPVSGQEWNEILAEGLLNYKVA